MTTRFFKFVPKGRVCQHAETDKPVEVARTGETDEHRWLKEVVSTIAHSCGFDAQLEHRLEGGTRPDVSLPSGVPYGRVEVQRVRTDVPTRTRMQPNTVWLLRAAFDQSNVTYLFSEPCVQVRIERHQRGQWIPAEPWRDGGEASVRATATVLTPRKLPADEEFGFFENEKHVPLNVFLRQIWRGERAWYPPRAAHRIGGWIKPEDYRTFQQWERKRVKAAGAARLEVDEQSDSSGPSDLPGLTASDVGGDADRVADRPAGDQRLTRSDSVPERRTRTQTHVEASRESRWKRLRRWLGFG